MSTRQPRTPKLRHHKPTGLAVVTLDGRDFYLGKFGSTASKEEYARMIREWEANGCRLPAVESDRTVSEVMVDYVRHVGSYYVKDGRPTSEVRLVKDALKVLKRLYGPTPAREFGPLKLKIVRNAFIESGVCRNEVNRRTGLVVRFFKWAVENEMVPASVHHGLSAVVGLRKGRGGIRESAPVKPAPEAFVDAIEPHAPPRVWAMVQLQRLTGMRPGEVCQMRTRDLDAAGKVWVYSPESHKTEHHGRARKIYLGPKAQEVVKPWLKTDLAAFLFSPREAIGELRAERRKNRKTPVQPSQVDRRKRRPKKTPGESYTPGSYRQAVSKACDAAGVPRWHPHQLRHNAATNLRREFGLDVARVILGHTSPVVTDSYAELDAAKALKIMEQVG